MDLSGSISGESGGRIELPASFAKVLDRKHPVWERKMADWTAIDAVLFNRVEQNIEHFLPKGDQESPAAYTRRKGFARFKGELAPVVERLIGGVFSKMPTRPDSVADRWGMFLKNVDGSQQPLNAFLEDRLYELYGFGAAPFLVDRPALNENGMESVQTIKGFEHVVEEREVDDMEIRLVPFKLFQLTDWDVDDCGELNWLRVKQLKRRATPMTVEKVTCYREYDRSGWRVFEVVEEDSEEGERVYLVGSGVHGIGIVPIVIPYIRRDDPMDFVSPFQYAHNYDLDQFRNDADLQYTSWLHAHPTIIDKRVDQSRTEITVGPHSRIECNPEYDESVEYLELNGSGLEQLRKNKTEASNGLRRTVGIDVIGDDQKVQGGESGRSKAMSFTMAEGRAIKKGADALQEAEKRMWEIAERWVSDREDVPPQESLSSIEVTYPSEFNMTTVEQLIAQLADGEAVVKSEEWRRQMMLRIVDASLGEIPADLRQRIEKEIEDADLSPPMNPLDMMAGAMEDPDLEQDADETAEAAAEAMEPTPLRIADVG